MVWMIDKPFFSFWFGLPVVFLSSLLPDAAFVRQFVSYLATQATLRIVNPPTLAKTKTNVPTRTEM